MTRYFTDKSASSGVSVVLQRMPRRRLHGSPLRLLLLLLLLVPF